MKYMFYFENGYFEISHSTDGYLLTIQKDNETEKLGTYHTPIMAADEVSTIDIEYDLPFEITLISPIPADLSEWDYLQ